MDLLRLWAHDHWDSVAARDAARVLDAVAADIVAVRDERDRPLLVDPELVERLAVLPGVGGCWGVGLWDFDGDGDVRPGLFVQDDYATIDGLPLDQAEIPIVAAVAVIDRSLLKRLLVVARPDAEPRSVSPGAGVTVGSRNGTLGCRVYAAHTNAATTAGHVARRRGVGARIAGTTIGTVIATAYLDATPGGQDCADLAVIALDPAVAESQGVTILGQAPAQRGDAIRVETTHGVRTGWVRGVSPSWIRDPSVGSWGQVAILDRCVKVNGDSGAPVLLDDGTSRIIGHVVAGASSYTLAQDVDFQLSSHNVKLRTP